jgi:hypothetical protein
MARRRRLGRVVIDTSGVIRAARAIRQQPPKPNTPELLLVLSWRDDPEVFTWLYSQEILTEYREVLSRLKVPLNASDDSLICSANVVKGYPNPRRENSRRIRKTTLSIIVPSVATQTISYSARSATIGSTLAARAAGIQDARSAAAQSNNVATVSMRGSHGETPKS